MKKSTIDIQVYLQQLKCIYQWLAQLAPAYLCFSIVVIMIESIYKIKIITNIKVSN